MNTAQLSYPLTIPAGADLSATPNRFVTTSSGKLALASAGGAVIGVLTNKPAADGAAGRVEILGIQLVEAGGTVTVDDYVKSDATGRCVTAASAAEAIGKCMATTTVGGLAPVRLFQVPTVAAATGTETVSAAGAISVSKAVTLLSVTGTVAYTLAAGLYDGQEKEVLCTVAASTPAGTITGAFTDVVTARTTALFNATGDYLKLRWNATAAAWQVMQATSITFG